MEKYNYEIFWKDPDGHPGTALQNAEAKIKLQSALKTGYFNLFMWPAHVSNPENWQYITKRGPLLGMRAVTPLICYRHGQKIKL